jgi:hypothetical protein
MTNVTLDKKAAAAVTRVTRARGKCAPWTKEIREVIAAGWSSCRRAHERPYSNPHDALIIAR